MIEGGYTVKEVVDTFRITLDDDSARALHDALMDLIDKNIINILTGDEAKAIQDTYAVLKEAINKGDE